MMTRLNQMRRFLMSAYQNENILIRTLWAWRVSRMNDGEIIKAYYLMAGGVK